jgi:hypothetical protein
VQQEGGSGSYLQLFTASYDKKSFINSELSTLSSTQNGRFHLDLWFDCSAASAKHTVMYREFNENDNYTVVVDSNLESASFHGIIQGVVTQQTCNTHLANCFTESEDSVTFEIHAIWNATNSPLQMSPLQEFSDTNCETQFRSSVQGRDVSPEFSSMTVSLDGVVMIIPKDATIKGNLGSTLDQRDVSTETSFWPRRGT